jgi:hypothetical protein
MNARLLVALTSAVMVAGMTARAHHSFAATYHEDQTVTIAGKLVQFLFRNPHSFVHVEAPDEKGEMQRWAVEWAGVGQLTGAGITRETLNYGEVVVITANPGRNADDHRLRMVTLRRPSDGFTWGQQPGQVVD